MNQTMRAARGLSALSGAAVVLASCTTAPKPPPKLETIIVPIPPNVEVAPPPPPPRVPITRSEAEDLWHLRSGLNVAALLCSPKDFAQLTPGYNQLLRTHKLLLTAAVEKELAQFRAEGPKWQAAYDTHMTKVYNQYSLTQKRPEFCAAATAISAEAASATAEALTEQATFMLTRLNLAADVKTGTTP